MKPQKGQALHLGQLWRLAETLLESELFGHEKGPLPAPSQ